MCQNRTKISHITNYLTGFEKCSRLAFILLEIYVPI